jgi:choline-phosphate cytidylyltransferase/glycerol-3-phosphate cytidylyltransferase
MGHVRLLRNARALCDKLIVGVTVDELVSYKGKRAVIPFDQRIEVVASCRYVDLALPQYDMKKVDAVKKLKASTLFVGDDWYGSEKWQAYEAQLAEIGCKVVYFPYSRDTSSTLINETLNKLRTE